TRDRAQGRRRGPIVKLREIAQRIDCRLEGDGEIEIGGIAGIEQAKPGEMTFFANPKYTAGLRETHASAVILGEKAEAAPCAMLRAANPYFAFARAVELFSPRPSQASGIHRLADVAASASLGADVSIGAFVSIGEGVRIGARTIVYPHVVLGDGAIVGDDCV